MKLPFKFKFKSPGGGANVGIFGGDPTMDLCLATAAATPAAPLLGSVTKKDTKEPAKSMDKTADLAITVPAGILGGTVLGSALGRLYYNRVRDNEMARMNDVLEETKRFQKGTRAMVRPNEEVDAMSPEEVAAYKESLTARLQKLDELAPQWHQTIDDSKQNIQSAAIKGSLAGVGGLGAGAGIGYLLGKTILK